MAVVWIPSLLQNLTGGEEKVVVPGTTVGAIIDQLESRFPGIKDRLVAGGEIRPHIAVAIDGDVSPAGLAQDVQESSEIHFIPALSGGWGDSPAPTRRPRCPTHLLPGGSRSPTASANRRGG
jgi:molybdopterin converting factor small subunit